MDCSQGIAALMVWLSLYQSSIGTDVHKVFVCCGFYLLLFLYDEHFIKNILNEMHGELVLSLEMVQPQGTTYIYLYM